ncbi:MAG: MFS transporter [Candidatus Gracilibacteria bacterium]|nr:MFS transporter [Candidatus Gracilibacteria bacterium]
MSEKIVISVDKELDKTKSRNLFLTVTALNFIWMLFHFTVVFFFTLKLKSVALVGVFLGIGNFFSFLLDIPIGILQNYFKAKTLYIIACISQLIAMIIFINFIVNVVQYTSTLVDLGDITDSQKVKMVFSFFVGDGFNYFLLLIASFCYGLTKELQDVTTMSYILNNSTPNQYASIIAKNNIAMGIGSLFGLLLSGVILSFAPLLIIFSVILVIILIIFFTRKFFDSSSETINFNDIYKFKVLFDKQELEGIKDKVVKSVSKIELKDIIGSSKYIFIKPTPLKSGLNLKMLIKETKETFITTYQVLTGKHNSLLIYWSLVLILTFGFRDTFASTFLVDFLDSLLKGYSYVLLGVIAIPAFGLQDFFGKLAEKFGEYSVANLGIALSGVSLFFMGVFADSGSVIILMSLAMINSIGYACCMSLSQSVFLDTYNKAYAEQKNLKEIDANASAAPIKIVQNFANVFGLLLGGLILAILNYLGFFMCFGLFILRFFYWSLREKKYIKTKKVEATN